VRVGKRPGRVCAWGALLLGVLYAAVSVYWGRGGTRLLNTVGGTLETQGRAGNPMLIAVVWLAVCLKLCAAVIGLVALRAPARRGWGLVRTVGWSAGGVLFLYGFVLTVVGMLVQLGVIATTAEANRQALRWHAYLWDPWYLVWGICVLSAMVASRPRHRVTGGREGGWHDDIPETAVYATLAPEKRPSGPRQHEENRRFYDHDLVFWG